MDELEDELLADELEELVWIFKALADPTRLRLIKLLHENKGAMCVNALTGELGVTQSAVSQHLRILRQIGLVHGERRGYFVHYFLDRHLLRYCKSMLIETLAEDFADDV